MPKPGPRITYCYTENFRATAVRFSQLTGMAVQDFAASLCVHLFMLSRWRKQVREGLIMNRNCASSTLLMAERRRSSGWRKPSDRLPVSKVHRNNAQDTAPAWA